MYCNNFLRVLYADSFACYHFLLTLSQFTDDVSVLVNGILTRVNEDITVNSPHNIYICICMQGINKTSYNYTEEVIVVICKLYVADRNTGKPLCVCVINTVTSLIPSDTRQKLHAHTYTYTFTYNVTHT